MAPYGLKMPCLAVFIPYGPVRPYSAICPVWPRMVMYGAVRTCIALYGPVWSCLTLNEKHKIQYRAKILRMF